MFKYTIILTQKTARSDIKSSIGSRPGQSLYHFYIIYTSLFQQFMKINRKSAERQGDVVIDIDLAVTFGTGFDRAVL